MDEQKQNTTVRYFSDSKQASASDNNKDQKLDHRKKPKDEIPDFKVSNEKALFHKRGIKNEIKDVQNEKLKDQIKSSEFKYEFASKQAARNELLLTEEYGYLEPSEGERTCEVLQSTIANNVDITSASKRFDLNLEHGPYQIDYTRNGRQLLLGGSRGHVAAIDWLSKKLICEMNVMEAVRDVKWLHTEKMFAVAQKKWSFVYDDQGTEIHCLKKLYDVLKLDFLPFHFLLVSSSRQSFLEYLDISVGKIVSSICCRMGPLQVMTHNPHNAATVLGHAMGVVTMWTPSSNKPVVKMLCHRGPIRGIAFDKTGTYMATSGQDKRVKIFDVRMYTPLHSFHFKRGQSSITFSDKRMLAVNHRNVVEVFKDPCAQPDDEVYIRHDTGQTIHDLHFCPFEDVLGIGKTDGFESVLVPGCAEANYDTMENNPYRNKQQRREWEVKALLEKVPHDMISLDPMALGRVNHEAAAQRQQEREKLFGKKDDAVVAFTPRYKKKGKSKSGNIEKRKKIVREKDVRNKIKQRIFSDKRKALDDDDVTTVIKSTLDRFK